MNAEVLAFVLYFVLMLAIGVLFFFKEKGAGEKEYFLGGRHMGPWVTAMSAQASDMSAWLLMGLPGSILAFGFGQIWIGIGLALGTIANWIIVARRLRCFSEAANDSITLPQYLSNRFATKSLTLQIICAVIFLVCFTIYVASAFVSGATVFTMVFPSLSNQTAMLLFALIIIIYTFLGGYKAVCWTDFFQGLLMLCAVLAIPIAIVTTQNLDVTALETVYINAADGTQYAFGSSLFTASWQDIISGLAWGLGYFGMPHIIVRFMSLRSQKEMKKSAVVAIFWTVLIVFFAALIGIIGRQFLGYDPNTEENSLVFILMVRAIFPAVISGVLLAAILAASMSTASAQMLSAASSLAADVYKPIVRKGDATEREMFWMSRCAVILISVVAVLIASNPGAGSIMSLVSNAWAIFGAAFGPCIILSLFWRRFNFAGALSGIVAGGAVDVLWLMFLTSSTGVYELLPGFVVGLIVAVAVTLMTPAPSAEVNELFDKANSYED